MGQHDHAGHRPEIGPVLPVRSLDGAEALHRALGLELLRSDEDDAWIRGDGHELWHLRVVGDLDPTTDPMSTYVFVEDPDAVRESLLAAGFESSAVVAQPWGQRALEVRDQDGNDLRLGCGV